jgi:hypothetical protein
LKLIEHEARLKVIREGSERADLEEFARAVRRLADAAPREGRY